MLTKEENRVLTEVGADRPMGKLMRQHWTPVCLSEEVAEPDGKPLLIEALGERLVLFRDTEGKLGLLDELCPHRRASLVLGRNEECGLRCLYHGWKMDVTGAVVAMPSEPKDSPLMQKAKHRSYPVTECGGFVWAWLGAEDQPVAEFRAPPFAPNDDVRVSILKMKIPANWAQITEGQIDSAHSSSLHSSDMLPAKVEGAAADDKSWYRPSTDKSPRMQSRTTPYGFHYAAIRRPIKNAATHNYVRVTEYVAPYMSLIPPNSSYKVATVITPMDDVNSAFYFIAWGDPDSTPSTEQWREFNGTVPGVDLDENWNSKRTLDNWFQQDRDAMKNGSFTGITGIPNQDTAMWVSMEPIVNRSLDLLGASDLAIVEFRRLMVDAANAVDAGEMAIGADPAIVQTDIASFEGVILKEQDWQNPTGDPGSQSRSA